MTKPKRPEDILAEALEIPLKPRLVPKPEPMPEPGPFKINIKWALDLQPPKASDYLIKGVIEPGATSIWFGPAGNGKTFLALHLLYAIAQGREVFGRRVRQGRTLYMALEGRGGIDRRVYALAQEMQECADFGVADDALQMLAREGNTTRINAEHVEALIEAIRENSIRAVVIDTLNLTLGGADENSNSDMGLLIAAANQITKATGAHVAFVAHAPKSGIDSGPRGGGAQKGNADMVVGIDVKTGDGVEVITASTLPPAGKMKDGAPWTLTFRLDAVDLAIDDEGDPITSMIVQELDADTATKGPRKPLTGLDKTWRDAIVDCFTQEGDHIQTVAPEAGMQPLRCTSRKHLNGVLIERELINVSDKEPHEEPHAGPLPPKARSKIGDRLNSLRTKGIIGFNGRFVWLL